MLKKVDFVEIDFVGKIKDSQHIFDLTSAEDAKKYNIFDPKRKYEPVIVCIGAGKVFPKVEHALETHKVGDEVTVSLQPEDAFGTKNSKLIQLVPLKVFKEKNMTPFPGLRFAVDGALATVRSVSGGRVILDFNHPLSGRYLTYVVNIRKQITETKDKVEAIADIFFKVKEVKIGDKIEVKATSKPNPALIEVLKKKLEEFVPEIKGKPVDVA